MFIEEATIRQTLLLASAETIRINAEYAQLRKLDTLQRSVSLVRARLGLTPAHSS